jgi:DnaK suppressor protein
MSASPSLPPSLLVSFRRMLDEREQALHQQFTGRMDDRGLHELIRIAQARRRIDQGVYGVCVDCEGGIDLKSLNAEPASERCPLCQVAAEHWSRSATPA